MQDQAARMIQAKVLDAYEAEGFAKTVIEGWAISDNDVEDLIAAARAVTPGRFLEVGTYVGVSTMALALACPEAVIYTVDPNFSIEREMKAVDADFSYDGISLKHHDIARRVAKRLGVDDRIRFFEGGFSTSATFTSTLEDAEATTQIVGPALCEAEGPFDFAFIDGLHSAETVEKDVRLAAAHLTAHGSIALHDCIGFWGAGVRAGVFSFLADRPEYSFSHPPYAALYKSVGVVRRRSVTAAPAPAAPSAGLRAAVVAIARMTVGQRAIREVALGEPWFSDDAPDTSLVAMAGPEDALGGARPALRNVADSIAPGSAIVCIDAGDHASDKTLQELFALAKRTGAPLFIGYSPPGETEIGGAFRRPLLRLIRLAAAAGLSSFFSPFVDQEPMRYALLGTPRPLGLSSKFLHFLVFHADSEFRDPAGRPCERISETSAIEREQIELERVHSACGFRAYFALAQSEKDMREATRAELVGQIDAGQKAGDDLRHQAHAQIAAADDLRSQVREQAAAADDLRRQVRELTQADEDLRRQVREQVAAADDLRRQVREQTEAGEDLRRQVREGVKEGERLRSLLQGAHAAKDEMSARADAHRPDPRAVQTTVPQVDNPAKSASDSDAALRLLLESYAALDSIEARIRALAGTEDGSVVDAPDSPTAALSQTMRLIDRLAERVALTPSDRSTISRDETPPDSSHQAPDQTGAHASPTKARRLNPQSAIALLVSRLRRRLRLWASSVRSR